MQLRHVLFTSLVAATSVAMFASSDTDRKIEDSAKASYNYRTFLDDKVTVKAQDGVVTLTGAVDSKDLKAIAGDTVSNLPGVVRVDNKITFDPEFKESSDAMIAWSIRYQLLVRASVSNRDTKVYVKDGVVTLTGTATTSAEKELVGVYATEVTGVKSVKNEILVMAAPDAAKAVADAKASADSKGMSETIDDASITSQVKYALLTHKSTSAIKTKVTTTNGAVVISGVAANDAEKALAGKLAKDIRGVKSVTNDMTIKG
jgi:osmotically-inducible protein OsmY